MSISDIFVNGKIAFMPYVCCGHPTPEFTVELIKTLVKNGAAAIELGIPFSDPVADGKIIQKASETALANGMTPLKVLDVIRVVRNSNISIPILIMTYYNILISQGDNYLKQLKELGVYGIVVPDVPFEESKPLVEICKKYGLTYIYIVAPNCSEERLKKIVSIANGFIYSVSSFGVTGAKNNLPEEATTIIKKLKKLTKIPIVVGFGISKKEHVQKLKSAGADGFIVGSKIIELYSNGNSLKEVERFLAELKGVWIWLILKICF